MTPIQERLPSPFPLRQTEPTTILELIDKIKDSVNPIFATANAHIANSNCELSLKLSSFEDLILSIDNSRQTQTIAQSLHSELLESLQSFEIMFNNAQNNLALLKPYFEEYQGQKKPNFAKPDIIQWLTNYIEGKKTQEGIDCFQRLVNQLTTTIQVHKEGLRFFKAIDTHLSSILNHFLEVGVNRVQDEIIPYLDNLQKSLQLTQNQRINLPTPLPSVLEIATLDEEAQDHWIKLSTITLPSLGLIKNLSTKSPRTPFAEMKSIYKSIEILLTEHVSSKFLSQLNKILTQRESLEPAEPFFVNHEVLDPSKEVQAIFNSTSSGMVGYVLGWGSQTLGTIYLRFKGQVFGCRFDRKDPFVLDKKDFLDLAIHLLLDTMLGKATELEYHKALSALEMLHIPDTEIPFFPIKSPQHEVILELRRASATFSF